MKSTRLCLVFIIFSSTEILFIYGTKDNITLAIIVSLTFLSIFNMIHYSERHPQLMTL